MPAGKGDSGMSESNGGGDGDGEKSLEEQSYESRIAYEKIMNTPIEDLPQDSEVEKLRNDSDDPVLGGGSVGTLTDQTVRPSKRRSE